MKSEKNRGSESFKTWVLPTQSFPLQIIRCLHTIFSKCEEKVLRLFDLYPSYCKLIFRVFSCFETIKMKYNNHLNDFKIAKGVEKGSWELNWRRTSFIRSMNQVQIGYFGEYL
jgi:hypothetical protein